MTKDLTTGNPLKLIVLFSLPLLIGTLFQQLYLFADAVVVGRMIGMEALASVGASGSISFLLLGFTMGLTGGLAIPVAKAFGAGDAAGVRRAVAVGASVAGAVAVLLSAAGPFLSRHLLVWMDTPPELIASSTTFLAVTLSGSAAMISFNFLSAIIRAVGDSRTPLIFLAASCVLNIALVALFVGPLDLGIAGAGLATVTAQLSTAIACAVLVSRRIPELRPRREDWRLRREDVEESLRLGLPMGFQMSIIAIGSLVLQYAINGLGAEAVASYTAGARVDILAASPLAAIGVAVSTFVAQNRGAGEWGRIRDGVNKSALVAAGLAVLLGLFNFTFGERVVSVFAGGDAHAAQIIARAHTLLMVSGSMYVVLALLHVYRSALQGMGRAAVPTLSGVAELVMRAAVASLLVPVLGFTGACLAPASAWVGALVPLAWAWEKERRRLVQLDDGAPVPAIAGARPA